MKSNITSLYRGVNSKVGEFLVNRLIPSVNSRPVGSIVFLDHLYPVNLSHDISPVPTGQFAHPHRGIATFSYVLSGSLSHYDSQGNHNIIHSGGLQWMKAGNGIIHDEKPFASPQGGPLFHSLQFWINLPKKNKEELPEYRALQANEVPERELPAHAGVVRILLGVFGSWVSPIRTYNNEFIYHLRLNPNSNFTFTPRDGFELAAFVPDHEVQINGLAVGKSKMLVMGEETNNIIFRNENIKVADVLLFGGSPYTEPVIYEGPFVMNSHEGIAVAYKDFFKGAYGRIDYL